MCGPCDCAGDSNAMEKSNTERPPLCQMCGIHPSMKEIETNLIYEGKSGLWMVYSCNFRVCGQCYNFRIGKNHPEDRTLENQVRMRE